MTSKSIEQLENDYWKEPSEFPTGLVERCYKYRKIPLTNLTIEQIRTLVSQNIGLKHLIGLTLIKLEQNILAKGDFYEGDLLIAASHISRNFWNQHSTEYKKFKNLVESKSEVIKTELGQKKYDGILERIK